MIMMIIIMLADGVISRYRLMLCYVVSIAEDSNAMLRCSATKQLPDRLLS